MVRVGGGFFVRILVAALCVLSGISASSAATRRFKFNVEWKSVTRLCHTKPLLTVNGHYPGPTIAVHEGDNVEIKVTNSISTNTTLHWHGIKQLRTGWADGPAYITQCPIQSGHTYTYKFQVTDQRGTLWWHSHVFWQRASVNGALIIYPRMPFPFKPKPHAEIPPIVFGEWWNGDVDAVEEQMMLSGGGQNMNTEFGSKILSVPHGTNLEFVFQNTNFLHMENHPIHLHGHNFFVLGYGFGNFDPNKHPAQYNLIDPVERNTVAVPSGGWAAIRFKADNPGAWFIHCHLEEHTTWGLATAFIVQNGPLPSQSLLPPPHDLPSC